MSSGKDIIWTTVGNVALNGYDESGNEGMTLQSAIALLQEALDEVPPEFRANAILQRSDDYDTGFEHLYAAYWRPKTDEDRAEEAARQKASREADEAREKALFARLAEKYGADWPYHLTAIERIGLSK